MIGFVRETSSPERVVAMFSLSDKMSATTMGNGWSYETKDDLTRKLRTSNYKIRRNIHFRDIRKHDIGTMGDGFVVEII